MFLRSQKINRQNHSCSVNLLANKVAVISAATECVYRFISFFKLLKYVDHESEELDEKERGKCF